MARPASWLVIAAALGACRFDADGLGSVAAPRDADPIVEDAAPQPIHIPAPPRPDGGPPAVACSEPGAVLADGHCYFAPEGERDWYEARDECATYGAHLVTIVDAAELAIVKTLATGERWLGLRKAGDAGVFGWITGEPFTLDAFAPGEPNGTGSCAETTASGEWRDHSCLQPLPMICERE